MKKRRKRIIAQILAWAMILSTLLGAVPPLSTQAEERKNWLHLSSNDDNGNGHFDEASAAFALSEREDIYSAHLSAYIKLKSLQEDTRFRLVTKYVDEDNWSFIGFDKSSKWFYQYKKGEVSSYGSISGLPEMNLEDEVKISTAGSQESFTIKVENLTSNTAAQATIQASENENFANFISVVNEEGQIGFGGGTWGGNYTSLYFTEVTVGEEEITAFSLLNNKGLLETVTEETEGDQEGKEPTDSQEPGTQEPDSEEGETVIPIQWARLLSGSNNGNSHFTAEENQKPEAFVLSKDRGIANEELSFFFKILGEKGNTRFRFVTKYVNDEQWAYIAYDGNGGWFYEYKNGNTDYANLTELPSVDAADVVKVSLSYEELGMKVKVENLTAKTQGEAMIDRREFVSLKDSTGQIGFGAGTYGEQITDIAFAQVKAGEKLFEDYTNEFSFYRQAEGQSFALLTEEPGQEPEEPQVPAEGKGRAWWNITSGNRNANGHEYGNAEVAAPALLINKTKTTTDAGTLSMVVKPSTNWGIFYNYVDNDNWLYVGWDNSSKWYYQYELNGNGSYKGIGNLTDTVEGEETAVTLSLSNETLTVTVNDETTRVTLQEFIAYGKANAQRGTFGVKTNGAGTSISFADVKYNGTDCMEDEWDFAAKREGQIKEKTYTKLVAVEGIVADKENQQPIENAVIRIGLNNTKTNSEGKYSFAGIEVGENTAAVTKGGYKAYMADIEILDADLNTMDIQLEKKAELNLEDYDVIENEDMKVYLAKNYPLVARYEMKKLDAFFRGNETDLSSVLINGVEIIPTVVSVEKKAQEKIYVLELADQKASLNFTMTVKISIEENTLTWEVTKIEKKEGCAKIATINIPGLSLLSVDAQEEESVFAGAQASTTTTVKADTYITFEDGFRPSKSDGYLYAFLSNGKLSAGLFSNSEAEGDKRVIRMNGADTMSLSSAVWYYESGDAEGQAVAERYPDYPLSELPVAKIAIADDVNKDGEIDWNDGALAYRKIMHVAYGSEKIKEQVNSRIVMNFASMAPNPYLATADNIKKVYLATDGLPQAVMLKGYGNEGHDSANSEYADIAEREGGVEDFKELIRIAHDYNTEIGIHINAQEIYPEAKSFNQAMLGATIGNGWGWLDQSHVIDKIWDLSTQARWKRLVQLYDRINGTNHYDRPWPLAVEESLGSVTTSKQELKKEAESKPHNMDFIYLDVWYEDAWETRRVAEEINSLGWRFSTEFSAQGEYDSTWQHWSTDAAYGGAGAKGFNSDIIRFIRNDQRDSQVLNYPQYGGTADNPLLGGYRLYGFEGWGGDRSFNNYIYETFNQNLPTKFLQHYYVTDWINYSQGEVSPVQNTEKEIKLANDEGDVVVVTRNQQQRNDDNIERTITLNGKVVLNDVKYLLPWTDAKDNTTKLYHWNMEGGSSTWQLLDEFASLSQVIVYELSDQGRINKQSVPVRNGAITLEAKAATAYVVVKTEGEKALVKDFGESDYVVDPGFNGYVPGTKLDEKEWAGDVNDPSVVIEKSFTGDQRLAFNSPENTVSVKTEIKGLKKGTSYVAEIYVQNDSDAKAYISVNTGSKAISNYAQKSILQNYVKCDNKNGTKMQRIQISFVPESTKAELILIREAGEGSTYMDDIRIVEKTLNNWQEDGSFRQDFETVVQGLYPFVLGSAQGISDPVTHLSQRNKEYTQAGWNGRVIDDVIGGEWSLKHHGANTGIIYQTLPQNFRFEPGKVYTVEFDYQSGPDKAYAMVVGEGELYYQPSEEDYLAQARGSENTKHVTMQVIGSGSGQTWIGLYENADRAGSGKMGETDFVLDNLVITEDKTAVAVTLDKTMVYLGERANIYGSRLSEITWNSSDESVAKVDTATQTVQVYKKGKVTLTANLPDQTQKVFEITVKDTRVEEIPREEYVGISATANTEELTGEGAGNGRAIHAVDGNENTLWHSKWAQGALSVTENTPAVIRVDFGKEMAIGGFKFLQRGSGGNGIVNKYAYRVLAVDGTTILEEATIEVSEEGRRNGTWIVNEFTKEQNCRYLEISVLEGREKFAVITEIKPIRVTFLTEENNQPVTPNPGEEPEPDPGEGSKPDPGEEPKQNPGDKPDPTPGGNQDNPSKPKEGGNNTVTVVTENKVIVERVGATTTSNNTIVENNQTNNNIVNESKEVVEKVIRYLTKETKAEEEENKTEEIAVIEDPLVAEIVENTQEEVVYLQDEEVPLADTALDLEQEKENHYLWYILAGLILGSGIMAVILYKNKTKEEA